MALYLVTGGAGFIGSHMVEELVRRGESVRVLDNLSTGHEENLASVEGKIDFRRPTSAIWNPSVRIFPEWIMSFTLLRWPP